MPNDGQAIPRATGVLVIEVCNSNPNGDPDRESDPRQRSHDGRGYISPVSFKRKVRDLVLWKDGQVWQRVSAKLKEDNDGYDYDILEQRGRNRSEIKKMTRDVFQKKFWDARVFGNTFLESMSENGDKATQKDCDHFIRSGVAHFGVATSVSPVQIERWTKTSKAGVEEGRDRGMAPLGDRRVIHGVYCMPFFVNNTASTCRAGTGCRHVDIELLLRLIRYAYPHTKSDIRPFVEVRHAWYAEHEDDLGSFSEFEFIEAMSPRRKGDRNEPSSDSVPLREQYEVPQEPEGLRGSMKNFCDLVYDLPDWCSDGNPAGS